MLVFLLTFLQVRENFCSPLAPARPFMHFSSPNVSPCLLKPVSTHTPGSATDRISPDTKSSGSTGG